MNQPSPPEIPFGTRFLDAWKALGAPFSTFSWSEIQALRGCDREGMVAALRRHHPMLPYAAIQRIRQAPSPEELAAEVWQQTRVGQQATAMTLLALLAMAP